MSLQSLQKLLQSNFVHQSALSAGQVSYTCEALQRLYHNCHWRKIDIFLIPAIRRASAQADRLLEELDSLSAAAGEAIAAISDRVGAMAIDTEYAVGKFCGAIEAFCDAMLARLEREEYELFPLARSVISGEIWFAIAHQMLAHDAYRQETKPVREPILLAPPDMPDLVSNTPEPARASSFAATLAA